MPNTEQDDIPADASLLRAVAVDVEEDDDYVFGHITGARLRKLAERLEQPLHRMLGVLADKIGRRKATIEVRYVEHPTGEADIVLDVEGGVLLLTEMQPLSRKSEAGATPRER